MCAYATTRSIKLASGCNNVAIIGVIGVKSLKLLPMSELDPQTLKLFSEEHLLLNDVVQEDADLLFLDTYLTDIFKCRECQ